MLRALFNSQAVPVVLGPTSTMQWDYLQWPVTRASTTTNIVTGGNRVGVTVPTSVKQVHPTG